MAEDIEGLDELLRRLDGMPEKLRTRTLVGWATAQANRMAKGLREATQAVAFKTGRLTGSIRGKRVKPQKALSLFQAIARAIAYASYKHGGNAWHLINLGTKPRYTKGGRKSKGGVVRRVVNAVRGGGNKPAFRGRVTPRRIVAGVGPLILRTTQPAALEDLKRRIERAIQKGGG